MNTQTQDRARSRRRKGIIAGVAGAALLLSGGTFALWQTSATIDGGTVTAGNMTLTAGATADWYDVSPDRDFAAAVTIVEDGDSDPLLEGEAINISSFLVSPEDVLAAVFDVEVGMEGDNLVGALSLSLGAGGTGTFEIDDSNLEAIVNDLTFESEIFVDGEVAVARTALAAGSMNLGYFTTSATHAGGDVALIDNVSNSIQATVVIYVAFDNLVDLDSSMDAVAALTSAGFNLTQVRDADYGEFLAPTP
ncbi:MAG: alternate-type signal peptide domain-containing protein [Micrococcales bacterium]|nr:alternate-type signal peptide domain-containing protein [Micrococcales bacterium]